MALAPGRIRAFTAATVACVAFAAFAGPADGSSLPDYSSARAWAKTIVQQMTLDEKVAVMGGAVTQQTVGGVSGVEGIPRLGVPRLVFNDGPNGIGDLLPGTTAFPAAIGLAAGWDPGLAKRYGASLAAEAKGKGRNYLGAPTINIVRSPLWGRVPETFGEDPFLSGILGARESRGMQEKRVIAQIKHYAVNDLEQGRFGIPVLTPGTDELIDRKSLFETYLEPFRIAIHRGGAASVMCSYNEVNGVQACESPSLLADLRSKLGFRGFVGNDAVLAVRNTLAAANAGLDNFSLGTLGTATGTPTATTLKAAVQNASLPMATVDAAVEHVLTAARAVGVKTPGRVKKNVSTRAHRRLATEIGARGAVLLRNRRGVLPLARRAEKIAVIGYDAGPGTETQESGSPYVIGFKPVAPVKAIRKQAGGANVTYSQGTLGVVSLPAPSPSTLAPVGGGGQGLTGEYFSNSDLSGSPMMTRLDPSVDLSSTADLEGARSIRWTGSFTPKRSGLHRFSLALGGRASLYLNGKLVTFGDTETYDFGGPKNAFQAAVKLQAGKPASIRIDYSADSVPPAAPFEPTIRLGVAAPDNLISKAARAAEQADVAVVFVNDISGEGMDRTSLSLPGDQDALISAVARKNPRTVVVMHTAGPVLTPWRHEVAGIVEDWYPGQQSGKAIAKVLFGEVNPSARLPLTFPATARQGPAAGAVPKPGMNPNNLEDHTEGNLVGYRYYDARHQKPAYPFGYGLSYTSFSFSGLKVSKRGSHRYLATVRVRNTGGRAGAEVVQLYLGFPSGAGEPRRQLKAFGRVFLRAGASERVRLKLNPSSFKVFDQGRNSWKATSGRYRIYLGTSSRDLPLRDSVTLP